MKVTHFPTTEEFVRRSAQWLSGAICEAVGLRGKCVIGLSGGSTPGPVYTLLATDTAVPWEHVTVFLADDRYIPADHPKSNQKLLQDTLLTREAARCSVLFPDTSLALDACVAAYDKALTGVKPDIVLLGMGDDGHIASLFPPLPPEAMDGKRVIHTTTDRFDIRDRISVSLPFLALSERCLFLISGQKKDTLLKKMQTEAEDVSLYPAQYLFNDNTTWLVGP